MQITSMATSKIEPHQTSLEHILDGAITSLSENTVVAITSKIVALCEDSVVKVGDVDKHDLIEREAEQFIDRSHSRYGFTLTIKKNLLIPTAGIDESNAHGHYVLWPKDAQTTANHVRQYLANRFKLKHIGVIITDSKTSPLRWGTTGVALAHSGFLGLNNYIGSPDIFGKPMRVTKANVMDALAVAAVVVMGEGNEQTPLAVLTELPFVQFQDRDPTQAELDDLAIALEDDLYAPILTTAPWQKGGQG